MSRGRRFSFGYERAASWLEFDRQRDGTCHGRDVETLSLPRAGGGSRGKVNNSPQKNDFGAN